MKKLPKSHRFRTKQRWTVFFHDFFPKFLISATLKYWENHQRPPPPPPQKKGIKILFNHRDPPRFINTWSVHVYSCESKKGYPKQPMYSKRKNRLVDPSTKRVPLKENLSQSPPVALQSREYPLGPGRLHLSILPKGLQCPRLSRKDVGRCGHRCLGPL